MANTTSTSDASSFQINWLEPNKEFTIAQETFSAFHAFSAENHVHKCALRERNLIGKSRRLIKKVKLRKADKHKKEKITKRFHQSSRVSYFDIITGNKFSSKDTIRSLNPSTSRHNDDIKMSSRYLID